MWNFDDVSSILTCTSNNNKTLFFVYVWAFANYCTVILMFAPMKIFVYLFKKLKHNFSKQSHREDRKKCRKTMEHKSLLTFIINSCVFVWGQSVYMLCYCSFQTFRQRVKPDNTVWMEETILKNLHICFPEVYVPNKAMIINLSV